MFDPVVAPDIPPESEVTRDLRGVRITHPRGRADDPPGPGGVVAGNVGDQPGSV